jgi:hypothetical protein
VIDGNAELGRSGHSGERPERPGFIPTAAGRLA